MSTSASYSLGGFPMGAKVDDDPRWFFVLAQSPFRTPANIVANARGKAGGIT
jgi:hypothetical protein